VNLGIGECVTWVIGEIEELSKRTSYYALIAVDDQSATGQGYRVPYSVELGKLGVVIDAQIRMRMLLALDVALLNHLRKQVSIEKSV
jgi:hypothetical protein